MRKLFLAVIASSLLVGGAALPPARSLDKGDMGMMSPQKTHIRKTFSAMAGNYQSARAQAGDQSPGADAFATFRPFGCGKYTYCDRVTFSIQYPPGYLEAFRGTDYVSFGVRITLTWKDPKGNNVDLFVWPNDSPTSGGPQGVCSRPKEKKCETLFPEIYAVVEPSHDVDDTSTKEDESKAPIPIYMSVVNSSGLNDGYTLDLQWFLIKQGQLPNFIPPKIGGASSQQHPITASETPAPFKGISNAGGKALPTIVVPGADGQLTEQSLNFVAAGNRLKPTHSGTASWVWISALVIAGIALLVFAFFVVQRRRQEGRF